MTTTTGMNTDSTNEEAHMLQDMIKRFCEREIAPFYQQWERDEIIPRELWNKLGAAGFL